MLSRGSEWRRWEPHIHAPGTVMNNQFSGSNAWGDYLTELEENLDPKSVFDELVALFVAAKAKRQVIMVTHNANLVINTDADQIIVATAGPHPSGGLPPITYVSGGLESAEIRKAVCDILEGGEAAFRERARRLRVRLER